MNLISNVERVAYKQAIDNVHDTFKRPITVWRKSAQVINTQNPDFDAFNDAGISNVTYTSESKVFYARIKYIDKQDVQSELRVGDPGKRGNESLPLTQEFQLVRIKVDAETRNYIEECEKINLDGDNLDYVVLTIQRPHGVFEPTYYTYYLQSLP